MNAASTAMVASVTAARPSPSDARGGVPGPSARDRGERRPASAITAPVTASAASHGSHMRARNRPPVMCR